MYSIFLGKNLNKLPFFKNASSQFNKAVLQKAVLVSFIYIFAPGCAHYVVPIGNLESPETIGARRLGHIEYLGSQSSINLQNAPIKVQPKAKQAKEGEEQKPDPSPYSLLSTQVVSPFFGAQVGVYEHTDLSFRFGVRIPLQLRLKHQFLGASHSEARAGDYSGAILIAPSFQMGPPATQSNGESISPFYWGLQLGLPFGYRAWKNHLFWLSPFFSLSQASGIEGYSSALSTPQERIYKMSGNLMGVGLGYQVDWVRLFWKSECNYTKGSFDSGVPRAWQIASVLGIAMQ